MPELASRKIRVRWLAGLQKARHGFSMEALPAPDTGITASPRKGNPLRRAGRKGLRRLALTGLGLFLLAPIFAVLASLVSPTGSTQDHIWTSVGLGYLTGTLSLLFLTGLGAATLGTVTAVLVSLFDFPGRRFFAIGLCLPFAIPAYITAYAYGDFLSPFGGLATLFDAISNGQLGPEHLPSIRSLPGAALILSLATYPYVYLAVRAGLASQTTSLFEAARSLGASPFKALRKITLPGLSTGLIGGLSLALMETASDYGVSDYLGIRTLTTGIFRTWYGLGDLVAATQIAAGLFGIAAVLLLVENGSRRSRQTGSARLSGERLHLPTSPWLRILAIIICALPVFFGFGLPVLILVSMLGAEAGALPRFLSPFFNTLAVSFSGTATIALLALGLGIIHRAARGPVTRQMIRLMTSGYAIPGTVIAAGILFAGQKLGFSITTFGAIVLIYAYTVRFLTAGYNAIDGGFSRIHPQTDEAAYSLGAGKARVAQKIHIPLIAPAMASGAIIVAIDIMRELPATLLLRPFNFETLATNTYRLASDERLANAAPQALALIAIGIIPVVVLTRLTDTWRRKARDASGHSLPLKD